MNKTRTLLFSGVATLGMAFTAHAQNTKESDSAPTTNDPAKTEVVADKRLENPVRQGGYTDAFLLSKDNNMLVVYISGGKGTKENPEAYTAKQYGEILQKSFASTKYTDNPTDIAVVWEETGKDRISVAQVFINGEEWKTKEGDRFFPPRLIGKHIDVFADDYAKTKAVAAPSDRKNSYDHE